jgi:hypothetical protein
MKANKAGFFPIYISFAVKIVKIYLILLKDFIVFTDDNLKGKNHRYPISIQMNLSGEL